MRPCAQLPTTEPWQYNAETPDLQIVHEQMLDFKCNYSYIVITVSPPKVNNNPVNELKIHWK